VVVIASSVGFAGSVPQVIDLMKFNRSLKR
jgi:hypothetical protein